MAFTVAIIAAAIFLEAKLVIPVLRDGLVPQRATLGIVSTVGSAAWMAFSVGKDIERRLLLSLTLGPCGHVQGFAGLALMCFSVGRNGPGVTSGSLSLASFVGWILLRGIE